MKTKWFKWLFAVTIALLVVALALPACAPEEVAPPAEKPPEEEMAPPAEKVAPPEEEVTPAFEPIKLRVATAWPPPPSTFNAGLKHGLDLITERTDGAVSFEYFWTGALGSPPEHLDLVEKGTVDIVHTCRLYTPGKTPLGNFEYSIPFPPGDPELVLKAKSQIESEFPEFAEELARYNCKLLWSFPTMTYNFLSKEPIYKLEDFEGKKVGVLGRYFGQWLEPAGLVPVVSAMGDRYTMLQSGLIDIDFLPIDMQYSWKLYEQAKYLIEIRAGCFCPVDLLINLDTWNGFTPELQEVFLEAVADTAEWYPTDFYKGEEVKIRAAMEKEGVTFIEFPMADKVRWAAMCPDTATEFAAEVTELGFPGWEMVERYQDICEELGYEWPRRWAVR